MGGGHRRDPHRVAVGECRAQKGTAPPPPVAHSLQKVGGGSLDTRWGQSQRPQRGGEGCIWWVPGPCQACVCVLWDVEWVVGTRAEAGGKPRRDVQPGAGG